MEGCYRVPQLSRLNLLVLLSIALMIALTGGCAWTLPKIPDEQSSKALEERLREAKKEELLEYTTSLSDNGSAFYEAIVRISGADFEKILTSLKATACDVRMASEAARIKSAFSDRKAPASLEFTQTKVLEFAEDNSTQFTPPAVSARGAREMFVKAWIMVNPTAMEEALLRRNVARSEQRRFCKDKHPRIHNIGLGTVLTFESTGAPGRERAVRIPFDGRDLHPRCVNLDIKITGTMPLSRLDWEVEFAANKPKDDRTDSGNADSGDVVLLAPLINRLKSNDRLTVQFSISERGSFHGADSKRLVSYATRTFTMYDVDEYRKMVLSHQVPAQDIRAFPLPETEISKLFGPLVAKNFFVIRFSVINREGDAKLISTGMITASGRALVEPKQLAGETEKQPSFTVPITIVPSSLQQTYTILDDEEVNQPRPMVFRNLEFFGALGTAATVAFGAPINTVKAISLFTGVIIPESKKIWPDRWPGYKRNIVIFAAPDLIKVPANTIADHKLLFFSKRNLELLLTDQSLFGTIDKLNRVDADGAISYIFGPASNQAPSVKVVSIAFDNLDVRFEKVFDNSELKLKQRAASLISMLPQRIALLSQIDEDWRSGKKFSQTTLTNDGLKNLAITLQSTHIFYKNAILKLSKTEQESLAEKRDLDSLLTMLGTVVTSMKAVDTTDQGYQKDLVFSPTYGLEGLRALQPTILEFKEALTTGAEMSEGMIKSVEGALDGNRKVMTFYENTANALADGDLLRKLEALKAASDIVVGLSAPGTAKVDLLAKAMTLKTFLDSQLVRLQRLQPEAPIEVMKGVFPNE